MRLAAVASYRLSGHAQDADLDAVVDHMARVIKAPIAVVNLVSTDRQCYPAERGVGAPDTHVVDELSFCAYVVAQGAPLEVTDARDDTVFRDNPLVVAGAVRSYLGVPLVDEDGVVLGALSVFDDVPRIFTQDDVEALQSQVRLVRTLLSLRRRVAVHEWDGRLLELQTSVLEAVATGRPLPETLAELHAGLTELRETSDGARSAQLSRTRSRLTQIAVASADRRFADERRARQDPLTGLANRAHLVDAGPDLTRSGAAVLFLDLDHFKEVNDRGGHALGDRVLAVLAGKLASSVHAAAPGAVVARLGGDEFAVVLPEMEEEAACHLRAELDTALVDQVAVPSGQVRVSASIGLAMASPGAPLDHVLHLADTAMYRLKLGARTGARPVAA
ncbi:hypothetical protein CAE01nite_08120 [Cellulomonas aerilata]|uniref:GGDEF domain-containing protein n=1 Tax=Cellulomonas aerilata TaxID=515326 RepID=A0A512D9N7_9CELL|nr:hypothetical protein CAE01nite_08120 [Cellulomonas aerilata]